MSDCVFCEIVAGRRPSSVVLENETVLAFVDGRQAVEGHVLVIPKSHCPDIYALSDEDGAAVMAALTRVARAVRDALEPPGMSLWQSNGEAAFQEVPHVHFHVHPRLRDDGLLRVYPRRLDEMPTDARDALARRIRSHLERL